jgi:hypothetical protein
MAQNGSSQAASTPASGTGASDRTVNSATGVATPLS